MDTDVTVAQTTASQWPRKSESESESESESSIPPGLESHRDEDKNEKGRIVKLFSGGVTVSELGEKGLGWRESRRFKLFTNVFVCDLVHGRILLGMKKRGFGKGMYNGFGGKVEPNESPIEAAARELKEEAGITASLEECGILLFVNASTEYCHYVHMYRAYEFEGIPIETEEMHPEWFAIPQEYLSVNPTFQRLFNSNPNSSIIPSIDNSLPNPNSNPNPNLNPNSPLPQIPLSQMWPDDEFWMPLLLKGQNYFIGRVDFGIEDGDEKKGSWRMEKWWFGVKVNDIFEVEEEEDGRK